ncbi:MAG TPA: carbohydrate ABC transporter permease [Acidimicrobiales bacterium]|nr:carbohydrate ABC transporter permease [Acidimicrobiales bacterium]
MAQAVHIAGRGRRWLTVVTIAAGILIVVLTYFPIVFVLSNSLKTGAGLEKGVFRLFSQFEFSNYVQAWHGISGPLINTIIVAAAAIVIGVAAALFGAYAFAQSHFKGKSVVFMAYIGLLMIPSTLTLIPLFLMMKNFGFFNSWWALILPYAAGAQPLLVLLFRGFFEQIPDELMQSARVDGAREHQILARIVAPLTRPIILTGAILMTITIWGDYIWPEVVIQNYKHFTISAGLQEYVSSLGISGSGSGSVFAAYVIALLPLFILVGVSMRYFVAGVTDGAVKL